MKKWFAIYVMFAVVCVLRIQPPSTLKPMVNTVVNLVAWKTEEIILWQEWQTRHADAMTFDEYQNIKRVF